MSLRRVVALAGGVGAAKFLRGLTYLLPPGKLVIVGNVGDDFEAFGLRISPDLDIVMYTLAGIVDDSKGWGVKGDTFNCLKILEKLGFETWFKIGDMDLAVHITRTDFLRRGLTLSETTERLCKALSVPARLVPMSDDSVRTTILSGNLKLGFQEYFVKRKQKDEVTGVVYEGAEAAKPSPSIIEAIDNAKCVVICPSNPLLSIGPILSVQAIKDHLRSSKAFVVGVSPIIGGKTIKGPADKIMSSLGLEASAYGVAKFYSSFVDHFVIDEVDKHQKSRIESLGIKVTVAPTIMKEREDAIRLARTVLSTVRC